MQHLPISSKAEMKARAELRKLASQLSISAIDHFGLWSDFSLAPDVGGYDILFAECECADRSHRKKNCPVKGLKPCNSCRGAMPKSDGSMYCGWCLGEMDRVMRARAEKVKELKQTGQKEFVM